MPIFEYICINCSHVMEKILKYSESKLPQSCDRCGAQSNKILSASNPRTGKSNSSNTNQSKQKSDGAGMRMQNCRIENCNVGISAPKGAKLDLQGTEFHNVKKPIEFRDE